MDQERFRCGDHGVKSISFNAACTHLAGSWRHDSSCCACQMLITERVTYQPEVCYPWLQKMIDIGSWTTSENLFTQWQDLSPVLRSRIFSYGIIRVSFHTLCRVRTLAACLIVHGTIDECVVTSKDGILSLRTARFVLASPRIVETAFLSGAVALMALCR